jgi:hypothetical protein
MTHNCWHLHGIFWQRRGILQVQPEHSSKTYLRCWCASVAAPHLRPLLWSCAAAAIAQEGGGCSGHRAQCRRSLGLAYVPKARFGVHWRGGKQGLRRWLQRKGGNGWWKALGAWQLPNWSADGSRRATQGSSAGLAV